MHVVLYGSMSSLDQIVRIAQDLQKLGHSTTIPVITDKENNEPYIHYDKLSDTEKADFKNKKMTYYFDKIETGDCALICNFTKNGIQNYIGGNTFLEMGAAYLMKKKIYVYNSLPYQKNRDELLGLKPIVINQNLQEIK